MSLRAQATAAAEPAPRPPRPHRFPWLAAAVVVLIAAGAAAAVFGWRALRPAATSSIPMFRVEPGTVQIVSYAKGTLQGSQADRLTAPSIGGTLPRISFLLPAGSAVKPGDVVVRFNPGQEQFNLAQALNAIAQANANIAAARDQVQAQAIQDAYSLQHARDEVQLAQIAVRKNPLLPALDAQNNLLTLRSAQAELKQLQSDIAKRSASSQGLIAIQQAAAAKAQAQADAARHHIASMTLRATRAGYVALSSNPRGSGILYQGMMILPFHVGDQVSPGAEVAQIPALTQLQMQANLTEAGSAYITPGQTAQVQIDGLPGRTFPARVLRVSGLQTDIFGTAQTASCVLALEGSDPTLHPGMDAHARIVLSALSHVLWIPVEALFQQNGRPIVYAFRDGSFSPQPVQVLRKGAIRVAIAGVPAGAQVALSNPTAAAAGAQP